MRRLPFLLSLLIIFLIFGCAMDRHRRYVRDGLLVAGLNRNAFVYEWGLPDRTHTISSEEFETLSGDWGAFRSVQSGKIKGFKGKVPLDVWIYEEKGVELIFNGLRLIGWETEKSVEELKILSPPKPQTLDEQIKINKVDLN